MGRCARESIGAASQRPDGILAAVLAIAIASGAGGVIRVHARHLADRHLRVVTTRDVPSKYQTLTFQRAALASGHVLPIYGSSELTCCGSPYRPTQLFATGPTGFDVLAVGSTSSADFFFLETFAALGHDLRGKRLVVSDSPPWFSDEAGLDKGGYAAGFLPEIAYPFVFDAPISPRLRQAGARRMLAHPDTLRDQPLLQMAVRDLADPAPMHLIEYAALVPLGRLATQILQVRDAARTAFFVWQQRDRHPDPPARPGDLDWAELAARATTVAEERDTTNPFGFPDKTWRELEKRPRYRRMLARYRSGMTNRDGDLLPAPSTWEAKLSHSVEWKDLRLELRVLRELGARPLFWSMPLPGAYDDYTRRSAAARQTYYERYERVVGRAKVPWLDFRAHDEDRYFLTDPGSHLSARGWLFADRALDLFWHGQSLDDIRAALTTLDREAPVPATPPLASGPG
jgi:poly-D-alanine transfer protein DltD